MRKLELHWQILIALILAVLAALLISPQATIGAVSVESVYQFIGTLFLNALKMLIVPLVVSAVIAGIAEMGQTEGFARLGLKTLGYYLSTSLVAILIGLLLVNWIQPGIVNNQPAKDLIGLSTSTAQALSSVEGRGAGDFAGIFLRLVPTNVVRSAGEGDLLGLIFFALLFAYFLSRMPKEKSRQQIAFWQASYEVMLKITDLVMRFAPIGIFGLVALTLSNSGLGAAKPLLAFFVTVILALFFHAFVFLPGFIYFITKKNPLPHYRAMADALLTAFSTSSSAATLPRTIECLVEKSKVSRKVTSFVIPLGATVNMDGTALYECVAAIFIAQCYGLDLSLANQFLIVLTALLTSIGVAGIPSASLVAIVLILSVIGLPAEGVGLILVVDRILDMFRTSVNVFSDSCGAVIIAHSEGEKNLLSKTGG